MSDSQLWFPLPYSSLAFPRAARSRGKIKIGVVTNCTAEFWSICEAGANKAAHEYDVELQFRQPEKDFDASVQMPIVEAWAKQGVNGIAVSVIDPEGQTEDLTRIAQEGPAHHDGQRRRPDRPALLHRHRQLRGAARPSGGS